VARIGLPVKESVTSPIARKELYRREKKRAPPLRKRLRKLLKML
jgi:hypothetical protein